MIKELESYDFNESLKRISAILDAPKEQDARTEEFCIPSELKAFTKESKSVTSNTDQRFKHLFAAIRENGEICALQDTLHYLLDARYNADANTLRKMFDGE